MTSLNSRIKKKYGKDFDKDSCMRLNGNESYTQLINELIENYCKSSSLMSSVDSIILLLIEWSMLETDPF